MPQTPAPLIPLTALLAMLFLSPFPSYGHEDTTPGSTFEKIQEEIFTQGCALQSCHSSITRAGGLSLEESAYHDLIGVAPANPTANAAGKLLVAPGDLDNSFLWHKITAMLAAGEGRPMPIGTDGLIALRPDQVDLIGDWILAGAPENSEVDGAGDGGGGFAVPQPDILPLDPPPAGQGYQVAVPAFALGDAPEVEGCVFVRLPNEEAAYLSGYEINMRPGSHHFIVYRYSGDACERDDDGDGTPNCIDQDSGDAFPPEFVEDIGCNDQGPDDRFRKALIAGSQTPTALITYPEGVALKLDPHQGLLLNAHYINYYSDTQAEVLVNFYTVPAAQVEHEAKNLFDVVANAFIDVPPFSTQTAGWSWSPSTPIALIGLTSHMHKRGSLFTIDYVGDDGSDKNPADGPVDPDGQRHLYVNTDYVDPEELNFDPPLIIQPGEKLVYTCQHDNGVNRSLKMGCEEESGVVPGSPLQPARACSEDTDCAGFGTGQCVPANLVFGYTSDDEMCIMPGVYYEIETDQTGSGTSFAVSQVSDTVDNPITAWTDENVTPSLSRDGTRLAFASSADPAGSNPDGSFEVFAANLSTSPPTIMQLTDSSDPAVGSGFPVLSDDGRTIAFTSNADLLDTNADGNVELFRVNFDGTDLRQLTSTPTGTNGPFLAATGELLNLQGLALSGDGGVIVFTSTAPLGGRSDTAQELFAIASDGTNLRQLTTNTARPDTSTDQTGTSVDSNAAINGVSIDESGSLIAFSSTGDYTGHNGFNVAQIFTVNPDGTNIQQVTEFGQTSCPEGGGTQCIGAFITPTMSDDGSRIGFLQLWVNIDNLAEPVLLNTVPFLMNADGTGRRQLFSAGALDINCSPVALSQDGRRAAFQCIDGTRQQAQVYINNAQGDELQEVVSAFPGAGLAAPPTIDDTGAVLAFAAAADLTGQNADGNSEVFVARLSAVETVGAANLENPGPGSVQAGTGLVSGWACEAESGSIDIVIDDTVILRAGHGTRRVDTQSVCGDSANGFSRLINWDEIGPGTHTLSARIDGREFARATFRVASVGEEAGLPDVSREYTLADFPQPGASTLIHWEPGLQTFMLGPAGTGSGASTGNAMHVLENPGQGVSLSGIGVISGWACDAEVVEVIINDTITFEAAYGTSRIDTEDICGYVNNGFSLLTNWNALGDGGHTIRVLADGVEFARTTFTVTTLGAEFIQGLSGDFVIEDFPEPGINTLITWVQSLQNFVITGTEP